MPKRLIGIAIAAICIIVSCFIPGSEALSAEGARALGLLLALVALWITSALPLGVTALLIVVLCPVLGVVPNLGGAIGGFRESPAVLHHRGVLAAGHHDENQLGRSSHERASQVDG